MREADDPLRAELGGFAMVLLPLLLALALPAALAVVPQKQPPKYFTQKLDHFNAEAGSWTQRYYVDSSAWSGAAELGPVLFIPGGEWSVTPEKGLLYGMVRELAVELGGIAMIAEHRFYGGSIPFNGSVEEAFQPVPSRIGLLSVAQAMADYAALINTVRDEHGCPDCPVISFGGSYSGKLSAYLRLKYPTVVGEWFCPSFS
jgi:lysosomal Pro-X carboxypeptidase